MNTVHPAKVGEGQPIYTGGEGTAQFALLTHRHADHYHPATLRESLNSTGRVVCHQPLAQHVTQDGFSALAVEHEVPYVLSEVQITAVPAVDGFGDDQVSWIIEGNGKRIIHCGDTLWRSYWWRIHHRMVPLTWPSYLSMVFSCQILVQSLGGQICI